MSVIDDLMWEIRSYVHTFGKHPEAITISEETDQKLCAEVEAIGNWTPWLPGAKVRSVHGGTFQGVRVYVMPSIDFRMEWATPE